jgi:hypothetical protein
MPDSFSFLSYIAPSYLLAAAEAAVTQIQFIPLGNYANTPFNTLFSAGSNGGASIGATVITVFTVCLSLTAMAAVVWGASSGILRIGSMGDKPGNISKSKERLTNVFIGAGILLSSYLLLKLINPNLLQLSPTFKKIQGLQQSTTQNQSVTNSESVSNTDLSGRGCMTETCYNTTGQAPDVLPLSGN